jgi:preprotein translocase subunit SecF
MPLLSLPHGTKIHFMRYRKVAVWGSLALNILAIVLFFTLGMNYGIDFRGGTTMELRFHEPHDIAQVRSQVGALGFGDVQIVEFGGNDVLIRVEQQPGGDEAQLRVPNEIRRLYEGQADFRRVEVVGPRVSGELARNGVIGVLVALAGIMLYIWFRFEWRFGIGAIIATAHDVFMTIGLYAATQLDFSLTSIAAILTIIGYSLNDTVVVYDRLRENLRRYKKLSLSDLIDLSINEMLSRTVMTSLTTLLALIALFAIGGEVIRSFTIAMIWGIVVGTYSSIFIAAPVLIYLNLQPGRSPVAHAPPSDKQPAGA